MNKSGTIKVLVLGLFPISPTPQGRKRDRDGDVIEHKLILGTKKSPIGGA